MRVRVALHLQRLQPAPGPSQRASSGSTKISAGQRRRYRVARHANDRHAYRRPSLRNGESSPKSPGARAAQPRHAPAVHPAFRPPAPKNPQTRPKTRRSAAPGRSHRRPAAPAARISVKIIRGDRKALRLAAPAFHLRCQHDRVVFDDIAALHRLPHRHQLGAGRQNRHARPAGHPHLRPCPLAASAPRSTGRSVCPAGSTSSVATISSPIGRTCVQGGSAARRRIAYGWRGSAAGRAVLVQRLRRFQSGTTALAQSGSGSPVST